MRKPWLRLVVTLSIFLAIGIGLTTYSIHQSRLSAEFPQAAAGVLDLTGASFDADAIIPLDGEWLLYPNQLIPANKIDAQGAVPIHVPDSWQGTLHADDPNDPYGFGTYRLSILLPPDAEHNNDRVWGLEVPAIFASYKLWVNEQLLITNGTVGTDASSMQASREQRTIQFHEDADRLDIVVQVSNYTNRVGGITQSMSFGQGDAVADKRMVQISFELFLIGALLIMGFYHVGLYLYRREASAPAFFGLYCLAIGIRGLFTGETVIYELFPRISWELAIRAEFICLWFSVMILGWFYHRVYPQEMPAVVARVMSVVCMLYGSLTVFGSASLFTGCLVYFQMAMLAYITYGLYVFVLAVMRNREGSMIGVIGALCLTITTFNDILFSLGTVQTGFYMTTGLFIFVVCQSFILAATFSKAITSSQVLTVELQSLNASLEEKVKERTKELMESNRALEQQSFLDGLTGIGNRRRFNEVAERLLRDEGRLTLLLMDIDHFKNYNDTYGHLAGDECLKRVAAVLHAEASAAGALATRYGGEEFAVIGTMGETEAQQLAAKLVASVQALGIPHAASSAASSVTISCGVVCCRSSSVEPPDPHAERCPLDKLIVQADEALYAAKQQGRNRYLCWEASAEEQINVGVIQ